MSVCCRARRSKRLMYPTLTASCRRSAKKARWPALKFRQHGTLMQKHVRHKSTIPTNYFAPEETPGPAEAPQTPGYL